MFFHVRGFRALANENKHVVGVLGFSHCSAATACGSAEPMSLVSFNASAAPAIFTTDPSVMFGAATKAVATECAWLQTQACAHVIKACHVRKCSDRMAHLGG
eukprot:COSAG02_NODE_5148_length_4590_cov_5.242485_5_plen_102_part_00